MANDTISESDILSEVVAPGQAGLSPESARSLLELRFSAQAVRRMDELADKNSRGSITQAEKTEMERYMRVGNFLNLVQAKARLSLHTIPSTDS